MRWKSFSVLICAAGSDLHRRSLVEIVPSAARVALECIGNSDALYHNVEHTMLVTLAGHDILRGRALHTHMTADDYAHVIIACLAHDIGYVRGLFKDDDADGFVIDAAGGKVTVAARLIGRRPDASPRRPLEALRDAGGSKASRRSTSSALPMRSKAPDFRPARVRNMTRRRRSFARRISSGSSAIPTTSGKPTRSTMSLRRSASIASLAMNSPADIVNRYPQFYWNSVAPHIQTEIRLSQHDVERTMKEEP